MESNVKSIIKKAVIIIVIAALAYFAIKFTAKLVNKQIANAKIKNREKELAEEAKGKNNISPTSLTYPLSWYPTKVQELLDAYSIWWGLDVEKVFSIFGYIRNKSDLSMLYNIFDSVKPDENGMIKWLSKYLSIENKERLLKLIADKGITF